jgi:hypothetical protein
MAAALNRFISKSSDRCRPFFQLLKKREGYEWGAEQERAFQALKAYLSSPPLCGRSEKHIPSTGKRHEIDFWFEKESRHPGFYLEKGFNPRNRFEK